MTIGKLPRKVEIATSQLLSIVGAAMELAGLDENNNLIGGHDEENREYWIGYRDGIVNLIARGTGLPVVVVRKELQRRIDDLLMEDTIEELFSDDDGLSGYDC